MSLQIVRSAAEIWEVHRVNEAWTDKGGAVHAYELIGRVMRDGALYFIEVPDWHETGYEWKRKPRGYQIPRGALRALCTGKFGDEEKKNDTA